MSDPDVDDEDAAAIGRKVAEMAERVKVMHAVHPGCTAKWAFEVDDVRFSVVVTVDASATADLKAGST